MIEDIDQIYLFFPLNFHYYQPQNYSGEKLISVPKDLSQPSDTFPELVSKSLADVTSHWMSLLLNINWT